MQIHYGKPIKAKNILSNGLYAGAMNWTAYNGSVTTNNGVASFTTNTSTYSTLYQDINTLVSGHTYFFYIQERTLSPAISGQYIVLRSNGSTPSEQVIQYDPVQNQWYELYFNNTITSTNVRYEPRFYGTGVVCNLELKTPLIIDLTAAFGAGNEPTAAQFYNKYKSYFPYLASGLTIPLDNKIGYVRDFTGEYTQLEYIESTGTQYINTNAQLFTSAVHQIKLDIMPTALYNYNTLWGSTYDADTFEGWIYGDGKVAMRYNYSRYGTDTQLTVNTRYKIEARQFFTTLTQIINGVTTTNSATVRNTNVPLLLFLSGSDYGKYRLYSCQLSGANGLVRSFIPAMRNSDRAIGLYDTVSNTFFTNQGTGTFLRGNIVNTTVPLKVGNGNSDKKYNFNSIIKDGNFESNASTYTVRNSFTCSVANNIATWTRTAETAPDWYVGFVKCTTYARQYQHKWYVSYYARTSSNIAVTLKAFPDYVGMGIYHPLSSTWTRCEDIGLTSFEASEVNFWFISEQSLLNQMAVGDTIEMKQLMYIDLTEMFGAGNEPATVQALKEVIDLDYIGHCTTPIPLTRAELNNTPIYAYNQLAENGDFSNGTYRWYNKTTYATLTAANNIATLEVTNAGASSTEINLYTSITYLQAVVGHKYYISFDIRSNTPGSYADSNFAGVRDYVSAAGNAIPTSWITRDRIITASTTSGWHIYCAGGSAYQVGTKYYFRNMMFIDLTEWFGAGNEPTTVDEFKQLFPNKYYPFEKKVLLNRYMINQYIN